MTFTVDPDLCIGCAACEGTCPEVFELVDGISQAQKAPVSDAAKADALTAEEDCPAQAISHVE